MNTDNIIENTTCHAEHKKRGISCTNMNCRHWIAHNSSQNCSIIGAIVEGPMTLNDIGKIFNVTRMRICQIEKSILRKITTSFF